MQSSERARGRSDAPKGAEPAASPFSDRPFAEHGLRSPRTAAGPGGAEPPRPPEAPAPRTPSFRVLPDVTSPAPAGPGILWHVQRTPRIPSWAVPPSVQRSPVQASAAPSGVIQRLPDEQLKKNAYYLVRYQENQLTARLIGKKDGEYQLVVVGTSSIIQLADPEDILLEVQGKKPEPKDVSIVGGSDNDSAAVGVEADKSKAARQRRPKHSRNGGAIEQPAVEPTTCVALDPLGRPEAVVHDDLVAAYIADLGDDPQHYLQEGEGQAIAAWMGVTALVMSQVAGPLIQSNNLMYGNGEVENGILLHIGGNHYIVIYRHDGSAPDFVDDLGQGYREGEETVTDGNCLIDGLFLIRDDAHATDQQVAQARQQAAGAANADGVRQVLSAIIIGIVQGDGGMEQIGARTRDYILRDPHLPVVREQVREQRRKPKAEDVDEKEEAFARDVEIDEKASGQPEASLSSGMALEDWGKPEPSKPAPSEPSSSQPSPSSGGHELEAAVTRYLQQVNLRGEEEARKLPQHRLMLELWHARFGSAAPPAVSLANWLEHRETEEGDYFGSDTESEDESDRDEEDERDEQEEQDEPVEEDEEEEDAGPVWDEENLALLEELNGLIAEAETHKDIEAILSDERFAIFVVPQYRGIAYMTNRFSKEKRRQHRRASQIGKPVLADAVRPAEMPREDFYTGTHGKDSEVEQRKKEIQKALVDMRKPTGLVDKRRRVAHAKRAGRIFASKFHVLQSDYSQDYTKSAEKISTHYNKRRKKLAESDGASESDSEASSDLEQQVYSKIPFRSHPLVSTADQPGHAVRYALGNKPIAAEKAFRLRPRWRRSGKPQHPYSGKVYTSLHPLRDYLSPTAPSSVWMGRALGTLSIDNDISKEGESSFLAGIKGSRVVGEQVIRWPSLEASKDESGSHGLNAEERAHWRQILQQNPPHSAAQRGMKSGALGHKVEEYYQEKVQETARRTAARRGQLLVYRNLQGGFSAEPPDYKTPGKKQLSQWELPAKAETQKKRLADIGQGKLLSGYPTEGYFGDWPPEEFYAGLSDEDEAAPSGGSEEAEDARVAQAISLFLARSEQTLAGTGRALGALAGQRNVHLRLHSTLAAAVRLVRRAFALIHQEALGGWSEEQLAERPLLEQALGLLQEGPPAEEVADEQGARDWLSGAFEHIEALLSQEIEELADGPPVPVEEEPEEEEQAAPVEVNQDEEV